MITAHLPSGYVLGRSMRLRGKVLWTAALAGAVLPDLDLIWFYFVDNRGIHHHRYWVHVPGFWALVAAGVLPLIRVVASDLFWPAIVFLVAVFVHILLDSIGGGILWLWPFDTTLYTLVEVPPGRSPWVLNFIFHWTFALELAIWGAALWLWGTHSP